MKGAFSFPTGRFVKNVITFGADMSSSVNVDNKKKYILIVGEGLAQGLDDTKPTAQKSVKSVLLRLKRYFVLASIIMEQIVIYLSMALKFIRLKQKTLKLMHLHYV